MSLFIEDVSLAFDHKIVLDHVTAEIQNNGHGRIVGILGPSGVGKTSLIRIIAGLQQPDSGGVFIGNEKKAVHRGAVGVVAQNYPLFRNRTVLGNLTVAARQVARNETEAKQKSLALLERFGLADKAAAYPIQLSGGMRQRTAIAQQLVCSEHLLIFDEPFSGLDMLNILKVCQLIIEVAEADPTNTVVIVTHDISAAVSVADTLWLMGRNRDADGRVISGAKIVETYDLIQRDLAWHKDVMLLPQFATTVTEIRARFISL